MSRERTLPDADELRGLYDSLARYHWWLRRLRRAPAGRHLELHKRLLAPPAAGPAAGTAGLHDWLAEVAGLSAGQRVLDLGCGFGATLLHWAAQVPGSYVGLTLSPYQAGKAAAEARRLKLARDCTFVVQSFDAPIPGQHDVVVAVEALLHAAHLPRTLQHVARCLERGGTLVLVEDMLRTDAVAEPALVAALGAAWCLPALPREDGFRRALAQAGLQLVREHDLTAQVPVRSEAELDRAQRRLELWRRGLPGRTLPRVATAFLGGIHLERLYARGQLTYRMMRAVRA